MSAARVVLFAQVINTISFFVKWEQKVFWRSQLVLSACYLHDRQTAQASVSVDTDHHPNTSEAAEAEVAISTSNQSDLLEGPKKKVLGRGWPQKKVTFWKVSERGRLRKRVALKKVTFWKVI